MSEETVINHLTNVCTQAKLDHQAAADAFATRLGWLDDPG